VVLPLVAGGLALTVFGLGAVALASVLAHWIALGAGVFGGGYLFYKLYDEDPLEFQDSPAGYVGYGAFASVVAYVGFELVSRLVVAFGVVAAVGAVGVVAAVSMFGGGAVVSALVSAFELFGELLEDLE
jgi:hypothetical protein